MAARPVSKDAPRPHSIVAGSRHPGMRARDGVLVMAATLLVALGVLLLIGGDAEASGPHGGGPPGTPTAEQDPLGGCPPAAGPERAAADGTCHDLGRQPADRLPENLRSGPGSGAPAQDAAS